MTAIRRGLRWPLSIAVPLIAAWLAGRVSAGEPFDGHATRPQLERRFGDLRARRALALDQPLLWRYRFSAVDGRALEALSVRLVEGGYRIESLGQRAAGRSVLIVTRVELHTPASLERRNAELLGLAYDTGVGAYDGADASPSR